MYCEFCGTSMDEGVAVCGVCGNPRRSEPPAPRVQVAEPMGSFVLEGPRCPLHAEMPLVGNCPRCGKQVCVRCAPDAALDNFTCTDCKGMTAAHQRAPAGAKCALHPEADAAFICRRCGAFACASCRALTHSSEGMCVRCGDSAGMALASRGNRFVANLLDNAVAFGPMVVAVIAISFLADERGHRAGTEIALVVGMLVAMVAGLGVQLAAQVNWGQSVGKRLVGIQVVRLSGQPIELWRIILLRNVAVHAVGTFCNLVGLVDALMIFTADQRCLHDYFADSKVIDVPR